MRSTKPQNRANAGVDCNQWNFLGQSSRARGRMANQFPFTIPLKIYNKSEFILHNFATPKKLVFVQEKQNFSYQFLSRPSHPTSLDQLTLQFN